MQIEYHFESGGFSALKPGWNNLVRRSCCDTVFLTWEWQATWWKHLGEGSLVLLGFRAEDDGRLVGIAPLFHTETQDNLSVLYMVGCRDVSDYLDLIVEQGQEDDVYSALLDYLENEAPAWDLVDLCNIPQDSLTFVRLRELAETRGYQTLVEVEDVCPLIDLPVTWDDYLMSIDKKQRHEIRRKLRRADGGADTQFVIVGPDRDLRAEMEAFIDLHQKSAPEKDAFMDQQMQDFFFDVAQVLQTQGWLQLAFVEMDGQKAASLLNFDYGGDILVYNSGYDPMQFRHLSPGIVVTARCIKHAIDLGRSKFDFLRGDEVYKYRFGAKDTEVRRLLIAKPGVSMEAVC
ncbi:MAG: GNAT family N-acetyltransferase [Anaerolineae bacterium]|jgi:CelD/BcsL family acetyltransferase involved in cellulose biosynthesis